MNDGPVTVLVGSTQLIALTMSVAFLGYLYVIIVPFLRHRPAAPGDPGQFEWHFLVPCRDREAVIGGTVRYLRGTFPLAHVWVIDDDSDDRTAHVVEGLRHGHSAQSRFIHLVRRQRRQRPAAGTGRGDALNAGYRALRSWIGRHTDTSRQILVVVAADGRPAANCLAACAAPDLFGDTRIGAVQIDVRMSNLGVSPPGSRGWRRWLGSVLVRMQDLEFRTAIAAGQRARSATGTTSLSGNGQFARLAALDSIAGPDGAPWCDSPVADFELGVRLLTEGWRTGFTMDTHVDQEGPDTLRRLWTQRTAWAQGTMRCARHLRRIWDCQHLGTLGAIETVYCLVRPWLRLPGTLVYPIPLVLLGADPGGGWLLFAVYGALGVLPFLVWGPIYWWQCERTGGFLRSIGYGAGYAAYSYTVAITSWRAVFRLARGRTDWATTRCGDDARDGVIALDH